MCLYFCLLDDSFCTSCSQTTLTLVKGLHVALLSRADTDPPPNGLKAGTRSITLVLGGFGKLSFLLLFIWSWATSLLVIFSNNSTFSLWSTAEADRRWFLRFGTEPATRRPEGDRGTAAVRGPDWGHGRRGRIHLRGAHGGVRGNPEWTAQEGRRKERMISLPRRKSCCEYVCAPVWVGYSVGKEGSQWRELRETGQNDRKGILVDCLRAFVSSAERKGLH